MKKLLRSVSTRLLWRLCFSVLTRGRRFVLVFHGVSRRKHPELPQDVQPYLTAKDLRQVLGWVGDRFSFLRPEEFLESDRAGVLLTFDDGLANNYTHALPVLTALNAPAVFFVSSQHVQCQKDWLPASRAVARRHWGREEDVPEDLAADFYDGMSRDQLAECARNPLITIGSHTVSHPLLTQCDRDKLEFELAESRDFLEEVTGQPVTLFAYPTGDYNRAVAEAVRFAGYRAAFAEDTRHVGMSAFEIHRVGIYAADQAYLSLKLSGLHRQAIGRIPSIG